MTAGRSTLWLALIALSALVHMLLSARVTHEMGAARPAPEQEREIQLVIAPEPLDETPPPPEEPLEFEQEVELDPPDVLVIPKAVVPPPPDVPVSLTAAAGGAAPAVVTRLPALVPRGLGSTAGDTGRGRGIGNGLGDSGNRFAAYVEGLREAGLDIVFVIDATGSMGWVIEEVKDRVRDIVDTVRALVPIARFGIVAYRDAGDPQFETRLQPLTYSATKLDRFLGALTAEGGGNMQEGVAAGVRRAIDEAGWRASAKRLVIVIGDAAPHESELARLRSAIEDFTLAGGQLSTLDVSHEANPALTEAKVGRKVNRALYRNQPLYEFRVLADAGGGDAATLDGDVRLTRRLITLIMGDRFATEMRALLEAI